jgi:biopolymer transport protein ExbD
MAELNSSSAGSGRARGRRKMNVRVDLTAMVDLAFLLITFFIMTTSLAKPKAMDIAMPIDDHSEPVPASRSLTICLGKNDKVMYYLGELKNPVIAPEVTGFGREGLRKAIMETSKMVHDKSGKSMIILIKPSDHSIYNSLVTTLDELNITQSPQYAIVNIAPDDVDVLKQKGIY